MPVCSGKWWQVGGMAKRSCMCRWTESGQSSDGISMRCESVGTPLAARLLNLLRAFFSTPDLASALRLSILADQQHDHSTAGRRRCHRRTSSTRREAATRVCAS